TARERELDTVADFEIRARNLDRVLVEHRVAGPAVQRDGLARGLRLGRAAKRIRRAVSPIVLHRAVDGEAVVGGLAFADIAHADDLVECGAERARAVRGAIEPLAP